MTTIPTLSKPAQWQTWFEFAKDTAKEYKVWDLVNPDKDSPQEPIAPQLPTTSDAVDASGNFTELSKINFQLVLKKYEAEETLYREREAGLLKFNHWLRTTVSPHFVTLFRSQISQDLGEAARTHKFMSLLQQRLSPSDDSRRTELVDRYRSLQSRSRSQSVEAWIDDWIQVVDLLGQVNPLYSENSIKDFIAANHAIDPVFASVWGAKVRKKGKSHYTFLDVAQDFLEHYREVASLPNPPQKSAFASPTLNGKSTEPSTSSGHDQQQNQRKGGNSPCVCGSVHLYSRCFYLNPSRRPSNWSENRDTRAYVNKNLENPKIRAKVNRMLSRFQNNDTSQQSSNFATTPIDPTVPDAPDLIGATFMSLDNKSPSPTYPLRDSFLLDCATDTHVSNNIERFLDFQPSHGNLLTGDSQTEIHGRGTAYVLLTSPITGRQFRQILPDAAYIPKFHTNLVCHSAIKRKGFYWDDGNDVIRHKSGDIPFAKVHWIENMSVLEHNPTSSQQDASFASKSGHKPSRTPNKSSADVDTWHVRLGHPSKEVLQHLPFIANDIEVTESTNALVSKSSGSPRAAPNCDACAQGKSTHQISRLPRQRSQVPFERIHFDLIQEQTAFNLNRWCAHVVDDCTRSHMVYTGTHKNVLNFAIPAAIKGIEKQFLYQVKIVKMDVEQTLSGDVLQWLTGEKSIILEQSAEYTPSQNGDVERAGRLLMDKARCMRIHAGLPECLWPETFQCSAYLANRTPTRALEWESPLSYLRKRMVQDDKPVYLSDSMLHLSHLVAYGCRAYVHREGDRSWDPLKKSAKLESRTMIGYLVGYDSTNIFRIWIPSKRRVIRSRDVMFNEQLFYGSSAAEDGLPVGELDEVINKISVPDSFRPSITTPTSRHKSITDPTNFINDIVPSHPQPQPSTPDPPLLTPDATPSTERIREHRDPDDLIQNQIAEDMARWSVPSETAEIDTHPTVPPTPRESSATEDLPGTFPGDTPPRRSEPSRSRRDDGIDPANIVSGSRTRRPNRDRVQQPSAYFTAAVLDGYASGSGYRPPMATFATSSQAIHRSQLPPVPQSWRDVKKHPYRKEFTEAIHTEWDAVTRHGTYKVVPQPSRSEQIRVLPLRWAFGYKFDDDGYLTKFKARICVRGDLQPLSELDARSTTLAVRIFRFLMALMAHFDLDSTQLDGVSAFCNSAMDEDVYCALPEGWQELGLDKDTCLKLLRALYGLRRAPVLWQQELTNACLAFGLKPVPEEPCLFSDGRLILFFYVDDIVILSRKADREHRDRLVDYLKAKYQMRSLGEINWFLNIRVSRDRAARKVWLCQDSYVDKLVAEYNISQGFKPATPLSGTPLVEFQGEATPAQRYAYQRRIGSLIYSAVSTRPDIAAATSLLSRFLKNPSPQHRSEADNLIAYLHATKYLALQYGGNEHSEPQIQAFKACSDAAFADAPGRTSTEGYVFSLFGGPIDWKSNRQSSVTKSTTEAELTSLSKAASEVVWWDRVFQQIRFDPGHSITLNCDNRQTINLLNKSLPLLNTKLRHVDIHQHWLREKVQRGELKVSWIPTSVMPADGFTKGLTKARHANFVQLLGLTDISATVNNA